MKRPKAVLWQTTPTFIDTFITYAKLANHGVKLVNSQNHEEFLNSLWCQEGLSLKVPMFKVFKHLYFFDYNDILKKLNKCLLLSYM